MLDNFDRYSINLKIFLKIEENFEKQTFKNLRNSLKAEHEKKFVLLHYNL